MNLRYIPAIISIICGTEAGMTQAKYANSSFSFEGKYFAGNNGDTSYLALLDSAYCLLEPNAELENLRMLYKQDWNGFVKELLKAFQIKALLLCAETNFIIINRRIIHYNKWILS